MQSNHDRYKYLIDARNYNFTQFNLWMAFFITINGALFIAYYNFLEKFVEPSKPEAFTIEKILILLFGYVAAFLFYCSAKGYSYWIFHSIKLLIDYENRNIRYDNDRIYSCIVNKTEDFDYFHPLKPANISTFKTVTLFAYLLTYGWGILLIHGQVHECIKSILICLNVCEQIVSFTWLLNFITCIIIIYFINKILLYFAKKHLKSDMAKKYYKDLKLEFEKQDKEND